MTKKGTMKKSPKILYEVWNKSSENISVKNVDHSITEFNALITSIFSPGAHYYYVVDFFDMGIHQVSSSITPLLGLNPETATFNDIINSIHPDDLSFVSQAEEMAINHFYTVLGKEKVLEYKVCYNFRSRIADGSYQLFHHQAIVLSVDDEGRFGKSLNVHTNINHITTVNNYTVYFIGLADQTDVIQLEFNTEQKSTTVSTLFSKRESEIINLMSLGFSSAAIAEKLFISVHTVKNHRKKTLKKSGCKTSFELIAKCMKEGLL
jgi:DNA-binding CsgD family transcriptional regulator